MEKASNSEAKIYEVGFLVTPALSEEQLPSVVASIKERIEKRGGIIISDDFPRRKPLAYEMSRVVETKRYTFKEAYFGWIKFELSAVGVVELKGELDADQNLIRFLVTKTVRENTLYAPRVSAVKKGEEGLVEDAAPGEPVKKEAAPASAEEIDKSIDALVIE